ncbi:MAG: AbiV family abortive infection protein [Candidatus Eisenbacteria bacterium]
MKVRRVKTLAELPDVEFLDSAARGSELCLQNAELLYRDAQIAHGSGAQRGYLILRALAEEEASKALILIDAVRCPPSEQAARSRQLAKFSNHLSRMIYSKIINFRPADFRELERAVEGLREEYFLDGPGGFDWIYRNHLLQEREGTLYVDYVEADDGRRWDGPSDAVINLMTMGGPFPPSSLTTTRHLRSVGMFSSSGMQTVAQVWRGFTPKDDVRWTSLRSLNHQTLELLKAAGLCAGADEQALRTVLNEWPFPLWSLDTRLREVKFESLEIARDSLTARYPEGF